MFLTGKTHAAFKSHFKLCIAPPPVVRVGDPAKIADYADPLDPYPFDAVCTNRIDLWQESLGE